MKQTENKMVVSESIAAEMMCETNKESFTKIVCLLDSSKGLPMEMFKKTQKVLSESHWIDTQGFMNRRGTVHPGGIYELFGKYSLNDAASIRQGLIDWINEYRSEIEENICIVLRHKNLNMGQWLLITTHNKNPVDEIAIYCLAKMYSRHVIIFSNSYCWSTLARHFTYIDAE